MRKGGAAVFQHLLKNSFTTPTPSLLMCLVVTANTDTRTVVWVKPSAPFRQKKNPLQSNGLLPHAWMRVDGKLTRRSDR